MSNKLVVVGTTRHGRSSSLRARRTGREVQLICAPDPHWGLLDVSERIRLGLTSIASNGSPGLLSYSRPGTHEAVNWRARLRTGIRQWNRQFDDWLATHGIEKLEGTVQFRDSHSVRLRMADGEQVTTAEHFVLAQGTRSRLPLSFPSQDHRVLIAEQFDRLVADARHILLVGGGSTGWQLAQFLIHTGHRLTIVERNASRCETLNRRLSRLATAPAQVLCEEAIGIDANGDSREVWFQSGRYLAGQAVMAAVGREAETAQLGLETVGVMADERGRIWCNHQGHSWRPHIRVVGDLIGFPRRRISQQA